MLKNSLVKTFYLRKDSFPENLFLKWRQEYVSIHGNHQSQRTVNRESLEQKYNIKINNKDDLYWLIFCLERFYEISLRAICANSLIKKNPTLNQICSVKFFENNGLTNYLEDIPNNLLENLDDNLIQKEINNLCESNKNIIGMP